MASIYELGEFIEGIHPPELREELPEFLSHIPYIRLKGDRAGAPGVRCVDGYYRIDNDLIERQIREYDTTNDEDAIRLARAEGLVRPLLLEVILTKAETCELNSEIF